MAKLESIWTEKQVEELVELCRNNKSDLEISQKIGKTVCAITHKKNRLKFLYEFSDYKYWTDEEKNKIWELKNEGLNFVEIAKKNE